MPEQSKFILTLDRSANEVNRRPNLKGEYKLAGEEIGGTLSLWGGQSKNGKIYARGQASRQGVTEALRANKAQAADVPMPPNVEIKVGEAVFFENEKATGANKQPKIYGYVREPERVIRLAAWEHGDSFTGSAELYVAPNTDEPSRPANNNQQPAPPTSELD